ncbi:MAG TPA: peptidylprolyl isomerase [Gammaproteobacteria bacterium]
MRKASARHILVETRSQCEAIKSELENGADFAGMAQQHSLCPSGEQGGDLARISHQAAAHYQE